MQNAGHGPHHNVQRIAAPRGIREPNIGHAIVGHALFVELPEAVREMKRPSSWPAVRWLHVA